MSSLWQDLRYALRGMRGRPWFTAVAVLTLALGIGATTTMFSVIFNVLLDPFPYNAERVVMFQIRDTTDAQARGGRTWLKGAEFRDFQEQSTVFEDVIGGTLEDVLYTTREGTEPLSGGLVSGNQFRFLQVPAVVGRTLTPEDAKPGAPPVFVMAYKMWWKYFNGDPGIVGQSFVLNGVPTTLVGIMPRRFTKLAADLLLPTVIDRANQNYFMFQGRLKRGVTLAQAESELNVIARRLAKVYPGEYPDKFTVKVVSWADNFTARFKPTLLTMSAAVGLLLLIACCNVANMLLARAATRSKEMAVRSALGASRGRLVRQLLVESLLLAFGGMVVGCGFAYYGIKLLAAGIPEGAIPREAVIELNGPVLLFSLVAAAVTSLVFGLVPALQTARRNLVEPLKDAGTAGGFRGGKLRASLVVVEVALSLVLLMGAGLLMRSFIKMQQIDLGFEAAQVLSAPLLLPRGQNESAAEKQQFFRELLPRLQRLPGVVAVATASNLPPYNGYTYDIDIPGITHTERWQAICELCSEGYFPTMGLRLMRGRLLTESEVAGARRVAVVNQAFVDKFLKDGNPLGRQFKIRQLPADSATDEASRVFEIVGVVSNFKNRDIEYPPGPEVFAPYSLTGNFNCYVMLRTAGDPRVLINSLRREIWAVDRNTAIVDTDTLAGFLQYSYASPRFNMLVLAVFSGVGLLLITVGVYSVMAYSVTRQTREIGIRMALGAAQGDVLRMVLRTGMGLVCLGMVIGLAASLAMTRVLASLLQGVPTNDPLTLALVVALIVVTGALACYIPARRAAKVDPLVALRAE